jgi:hypothetical protein
MAAVNPEVDRRMKLVIRNLPNSAEEPGVLEAFLQATLPNVPRLDVRLLRRPPALYAFVTFPTEEDRDIALAALNGAEMEGHALVVEGGGGGPRVLISNIPDWVGIPSVLALASNFGVVVAHNALPPNPMFPGLLAVLVQMRTREEAIFLVANVHNIPMRDNEEREYALSAVLHAPMHG